jgi:hypothetical protein
MKPWKPSDLDKLRRYFPKMTTADLAEKLGRSAESVNYKAADLGLRKDPEHKAKQSRLSALSAEKTPEEMRALGSRGGKVGGPARAASLTPAKRKRIAKKAIAARWARQSAP